MEGLDKKYDFYRAVIGDTLFNQQFFEEALEFYEEAIQLNPADDNYYLKGSRTSSNLGSHGKALKYIDKALKLNYERADLLACKGSVLSNLKENKEAIVLFSQAIEGESDSKALAGYYRLRGTAYQTLGLQNEANADFANEQKFK
jgi:tetratricopeptide (TPR) repeat protein